MRMNRRQFTTTSLAAVAAPATVAGVAHADRSRGGADLILTGGQVVTMDESRPFAQAIAIMDGRITAVGSEEVVARHRGPATRVIDLRKKTVIPGLQDSHIHLETLGWDLANVADLSFAVSQEDVLDTIRTRMARLDVRAGEWVEGTRWQDDKYAGGMVTRWQLDEIAPNNPVYLSAPGGAGGIAVNTQVFALMGIKDEDPSTWPSWWLEDPEDFTFADEIVRVRRMVTTVDGETRELEIPTGVFRFAHGGSPAGRLVTVGPPARSFEDQIASLRDGAREMLRLGVTAIVDTLQQGAEVYREAYRRGLLPHLRIVDMYRGGFRTQTPAAIADYLEEREQEGDIAGNPYLVKPGAKFFADGGALTRTAWLSEPFHDWENVEGEPNTGFSVVADDGYREAQYRAVADRGWTLHTHATGDRAMRQVVDLYAKIMAERPAVDLRWTIEHSYLPLEAETRTIDDMARHGIIASVQPNWNYQHGAAFLANLGPERFARATPVASYLRAGVVVASGSDYPPNHHNPWLGIYSLLTRETMGTGYVAGQRERVSVLEALRTYTLNGAYLATEERTRGSLEVGKVADLVVLDLENIGQLQARPKLALDMSQRVVLTLVDGQAAYTAPGFAP